MNQQQSATFTRRKTLLTLLALGATPALQGCFPVVATGVAAGAAMVADRRTSGSYVEDEGIEWRTRSRIRERFGDSVNISVTSYNRNVLLTGEVPNEQVRTEAEQIATAVANVRAVMNETRVAGISTLSARANDTMITSKVKARFVDDNSFGTHHVKVVTEAGTVFLMGLVTRAEADAATEVARTTAGVQKVVRVFEYISAEEAKRLDARVGESK
ncbi:BON domain-containing protein [Pseudothauera nasutitermitis]